LALVVSTAGLKEHFAAGLMDLVVLADHFVGHKTPAAEVVVVVVVVDSSCLAVGREGSVVVEMEHFVGHKNPAAEVAAEKVVVAVDSSFPAAGQKDLAEKVVVVVVVDSSSLVVGLAVHFVGHKVPAAEPSAANLLEPLAAEKRTAGPAMTTFAVDSSPAVVKAVAGHNLPVGAAG